MCAMISHKPIMIHMGGLVLGVNTLYRLFCFFKLFPMVGKGLKVKPTPCPSPLLCLTTLNLPSHSHSTSFPLFHFSLLLYIPTPLPPLYTSLTHSPFLQKPFIGVHASSTALLYCITGPVGPYFSSGTFEPVSLYADPQFIRAWPGGVGDSKMGG